MKRSLLIVLFSLISLSSITLVVLQVFQMRKSVEVSDNLFNISVNNSMDNIVAQFDQMKFDEYVNQKDRYKIQKYRRMEELNNRMVDLIRQHDALFYDESRTLFSVALQDSVYILKGVHLSPMDSNVVKQYNTLLNARRRLVSDDDGGTVSFLLGDGSSGGLTVNDINYSLLDSLIREELIINGVDLEPEIGVVNATQDEYIYVSDNEFEKDLKETPYKYSFRIGGIPSIDDYYIALSFHAPVFLLRANQHLFMFGSIFLIVVLFVSFLITMHIILNQRKLDEMKTDFINNMTHEVKTPISTIGLACEMLRDPTVTQDEETRHNFLNIINDENRRMRGLIEMILQSSKMGNKNYQISLEEVDVHTVIQEVVGSFSLALERCDGHIDLHLEASPSSLYVDKLHFTNLVYNLVDNAIKYSSESPRVIVSTALEPKYLVLKVQDFGIGISKEDQKHIFEKFYRVSTGNVHNVKGFGIGLNYVSQVVALHHGKIAVESQLGQGSTFEVRLPVF